MQPGDDHLIVDRVETDESGNIRIFAKATKSTKSQLSIQKQRKLKFYYKKEMGSHFEAAKQLEEEIKGQMAKISREGVDWSEMEEGLQQVVWKRELYEHLVKFEYDEAIKIVDYIKKDLQKHLDEVLFEEDVNMTVVHYGKGDKMTKITKKDDEIALVFGDQLNYVNNVIVGQHLERLKRVLEKCTDVV